LSVAQFVTASGTFPFEGIERDLLMTIIRPGKWIGPVGATPVFAPLYTGSNPQAFDTVVMEFSLWTGQPAALLESYLPPYARGKTFDLWLPGTSTVAAVPGFGTWSETDAVWKIVKCTLKSATRLESLGRKAPRVDLFGYRLTVRFCASVSHGSTPRWDNERGGVVPTFSTTVPAIMPTKFIAHQIQDWSNSFDPLPNQETPTRADVQHGRRVDAGQIGDHVDAATMDGWITWYRAIRGSAFPLTMERPFGPHNANTVNAVARGMKINRVAGYWEAKLDLSLAQ
jgi:hypothetical protein